MTPQEYVANAVRTESNDFMAIKERFGKEEIIRLIHASQGMQTESAEFTDVLKKYLFYGKETDRTNMAEEIGDIMWYVAIACDALGVDLEEVMKTNINKLKARFPDKFTESDAVNRNLDKERETLEEGHNLN